MVMKKYVVAIFLMLMGLVMPLSPVLADPNPPRLVISQFKITSSNGQFFTLYNNTNSPIDMSKVQLQYFNNYDLSKATTVKNLNLSGTLPAYAYYGVNDGVFQLCYQSIINSASLGFNSTAGMVQISEISQSGSGHGVSQTIDDYVAWAANGTKNLPANVQPLPIASATSLMIRQPMDANNNPSLNVPGGGSWQTANVDNNCNVTLVSNNTIISSPLNQLLPGSPPPATIVNVSDDEQPASGALPPADIGLAAPQVNEALPNPAEPQTDSEDEFIELYNSNGVAFDLTGFKLQTGTTTLHNYTFPVGTMLAPKSFTAFYSIDTGLSLSNSSGQARLLDPVGNTISQSDIYGTAKEGQTWALANGAWYWSTTVTPNAANIVRQPLSVQSLSVGTTAKSASTTAKKSATTAGKTAATPKVKAASTSTSNVSSSPAAKNASPLHPLVLAGVGLGAVAYAAYEYRNDLRNRLYQFRRYRAARATAGAATGSAGAGRVESRFGGRQDNFRSRFSSWFGK